MSYTQVGKRIRELREIQNYTRDVFAEKVGISSKFLYEIETGKKGFSVKILSTISKELSVSSDYLLFGEEDHRSSEKIVCVLETLNPNQVSKIKSVLQILYSLCDAF